MFRTTLRSLWSHKRRLISTSVAVLLGVAFVAGTLVLTGTINRVFDSLFSDAYAGTDAVVRGEVTIESDFGMSERKPIPEELSDQLAEVDGVDGTFGVAFTMATTLLDAEGDPMTTGGAPSMVSSWIPDEQVNPYVLDEGRAPEQSGEVVVDRNTANNGPFEVGDTLEVITTEGPVELELVGVARFGDADSAAGAIDMFTTVEQSQEFTGLPGFVNEINVRAADGVSDEEVVTAIEAADLEGIDVVTGEAAGEELADDIGTAFGFFTVILLVFAGVALFVGWFIISNTFSILVSQRTKELALLRAIGASRRQVLGSVLLEAGMVGLISSILGLVAGVGLATAALAALEAFGVDLPSVGLVIGGDVIIWSLVVGVVLTVVAAMTPAIHATRVPPIAALRDVALDTSHLSKVRIVAGVLALVVGIVSFPPAFADDVSTKDLPGIGIGMAALLAAVLILGPIIARPLSRFVGLPLPSLRGVTGQLARENAMRNPRRTASTAAAIIIGVTLVGFITIFASSAQDSIRSAIEKGFKGDYIIQPANQFADVTGAPRSLSEELAETDGVSTVTAMSVSLVRLELDGETTRSPFVSAIDPSTFPLVFDTEMAEGDLASMTADGIIVDWDTARNDDVEMGDVVTLVTPTGEETELTVQGISNDAILEGWTMTRDRLSELVPRPADYMLGILTEPGTETSALDSDLEATMDGYPTMNLMDREEFTQSIIGAISAMVNVIYGLLAISVVIALIGIANTLSLSIFERTRELGLLRAMGMTRNQMRSLVRWEAVIVALIGSVLGLVLGVGLAWILVNALSNEGFDTFNVPFMPMAVIVVGAAVLGVVAALLPARRASRLNVLDAIATE